MNNSILFDFKDGALAKYIEKLIDEKIYFTNGGYFKPEVFDFNKVKISSNYFYCDKGNDSYIVFAYLRHFYTQKHNSLPKFHVTDCETRNSYVGFSFSNSMPVNIISRDEPGKDFSNVYLNMCGNCKRQMRQSFFSWGNTNWFDAVLHFADKKVFTDSDRNQTGYVKFWKQISEAKRMKVKFICENCKVDLKNHPVFLEVHHNDKDPLNNKKSNLVALCVKCHAKHHPHNYSSGTNLLKLQRFEELVANS